MLKKKPVKNSDKISVTFALEALEREVNEVNLVGDFNEWSPEKTPMKQRKDGAWAVALRLEPSRRYEYRFVVDGTDWCVDESADDFVANPFGGRNSVVAL